MLLLIYRPHNLLGVYVSVYVCVRVYASVCVYVHFSADVITKFFLNTVILPFYLFLITAGDVNIIITFF